MKRFESIINNAIKQNMSDIHITGEHPVVSRKDGDIQFHTALIFTHKDIDDLTRKLLTPMQLDRLRQKNSVDISFSSSNARLRINIFNSVRGISIAIRILPGHIPTIEELNLHPSLHDISQIKSGLVLICGGSGVGKTTTIAAIINDINKTRQAHIVTLEDPIEYRFQSLKSFIEQRELGSHMPSFEQGLTDVLREDADVIVVGELRDGETMRLALTAAESGHLVIATLHAATPEEAIYRMCNAVPADAQNEVRNQLASMLSTIIVQQLSYLEKAGQRVPVLSIIHGTTSIKNIIRDNKLHLMSNSLTKGMFTAESYLTEYLNTLTTFTAYGKIFRPSGELSQNDFYQSPLMMEVPQVNHTAKHERRMIKHDRRNAKHDRRMEKHEISKASPSIVGMSKDNDENIDRILNISDDMSLDNLIEKLNNNSV
jgi:pilus retraction protein PilT